MAQCCSHIFGHYFSLYMKSLAQKLTEKMRFSQIIMYVTICDLHGHRRSQVMVRNESLSMSSYLMNNCNYRPISHRY